MSYKYLMRMRLYVLWIPGLICLVFRGPKTSPVTPWGSFHDLDFSKIWFEIVGRCGVTSVTFRTTQLYQTIFGIGTSLSIDSVGNVIFSGRLRVGSAFGILSFSLVFMID